MLSRRAFLASTAAAAFPLSRARADEIAPTVLRIERAGIEVNGRAASMLALRQPNGKPGLETKVGDAFRVRLENHLSEPSLIHWHGLTPPWRQDGVPYISAPPIQPGGFADYDFPLAFDGTFFMHSHEGLQEQLLLSAPLIIHAGRKPRQQEIIVELADFSFTPPEEIYANLRKTNSAPPMAHAGMAHAGMAHGAMGETPEKGEAPVKMDAAKPDLNDVKYDAFLANRRTLADPEIVKVEAGEPALLRIINSSAMSAYHVELGELQGELVAVDGHAVAPIAGRRFPIAVAQRLDVKINIPRGRGAYQILAHLEGDRGRSGVILVTRGADVRRIAELGDVASPPLTLDLERRLRGLAPLKPRAADRVHTLNLTGDMTGYQWSINDVAWTEETPPLPVSAGERVELVFVNQTMMPHPMHLHGHVFQVVGIDGERFAGAVRDTVLVPPKTTVTVAFDADNPGWWALHCHLVYHMAAGMFTTVKYG